MHPQWHRSCCFFLGHDFCLGTHSRLGAQKPPLVQILPSRLGVKTKNKTKRSWLQMHPNGVGPVAFFLWGHILAWVHKNLLWFGFCPHVYRGWRLKTKQKSLDHKCTPMVLVLLLSFEAQLSLAWGGPQFSLWGHGPEMTHVAPSLHGCLCRKFTALVL